MYKEHPALEPPGSDAAKIWRYMDFARYVSLLSQKSLFFVRADEFEDPYEGRYPDPMAREVKQFVENLREGIPESYRSILPPPLHQEETFRSITYISCWHLGEDQSAAMWKLYAGRGQGVAIQSTFGLLRAAFAQTTQDVFIGVVGYKDYSTESIPPDSIFKLYLYKRRSFEYEQELRAIVWPEFEPGRGLQGPTGGIYVPVNLDTLIREVYVAPKMPDWSVSLVRDVSTRYGIEKPVVKSSLLDGPLR